MSDPYMQCEEQLQITRGALEVIAQYGFGLSILTKSNLILRDIDLLKRIHQQAKCVVQMTLTTYDEQLCKIIEPNVCSTKERFAVLERLTEEKIPTVVWITPILPMINDSKENLEGILKYCIEANVKGIICFGMGLTLREGNREYYYQKLDKHFPHLKRKYEQNYGNAYVIQSDNNTELMDLLEKKCRKNNIMCTPEEVFAYLHHYESKNEGEQMTLFD